MTMLSRRRCEPRSESGTDNSRPCGQPQVKTGTHDCRSTPCRGTAVQDDPADGYNVLVMPAVFLDRDGVLIQNRDDYVRAWKDVTLYPQALDALSKASRSPYRFVIITNQSGIGRGLMSMEAVAAVNARIVQAIEEKGGRIDGVFVCPHTPEDVCLCRKPKPGLILEAASTLDLDLQRSVLIGDALSDIQAGRAAGVGRSWILLSGRGEAQLRLPEAAGLLPIPTFGSLALALDALVSGR